MKKNKMMRIASVLLVLTLISTCAISGTFAKYVTKAEGEDTARVAKWGILITLTGDELFAEKYETDDTETYDGDYSVETSVEGDKLVAPGTKNDEGLVATVKGTPEVATKFTLAIAGAGDDEEVKVPYLPAGTYTDYTELVKNDDGEYGYFNTFTLDEDYYPVVFTLTVDGKAGDLTADNKTATFRNLDELSTLLQGMEMVFDPNTEIDATFSVTWEWAFEQEDVELYDKADTLLGNLIAAELDNIELPVAEGAEEPEAELHLSFSFTATAVQVD